MKEYIEREVIEKFIEAGLNNPDKNKAFGHDAIEIMAGIHFMPVAGVAPIRHAHWFDVGSLSCRCSGCGCKSERETAYCPNCGAKMQPVGNPDMLNTPQTHEEEKHMYIKKFSSILDVISHELSDGDLIRWVSQRAMESEENSREVAEKFGYECE